MHQGKTRGVQAFVHHPEMQKKRFSTLAIDAKGLVIQGGLSVTAGNAKG